jgi:hypothetical protein
MAWASASLVAFGGLGAWSVAVPSVASEEVAPSAPPLQIAPHSAPDAKFAAALRERDPFRFDRRPTDVRYNPWEPVSSSVAAPRPARPALAVVGIVGGPPWNALVQGIPGREGGALVTTGDTVNGIRIVRISRDTAYLAGFDTTWALTPRRSWQ